jgi:hypothetical protein
MTGAIFVVSPGLCWRSNQGRERRSLRTVASSGLRPSRALSNGCDPFRVFELLLASPWGDELEACSTWILVRRGGVTIDRHAR